MICYSFLHPCTVSKQLLSVLDKDKDGIITCKDLNATGRFEWRALSQAVFDGEADMQNGFDFEFGILDYEAVW